MTERMIAYCGNACSTDCQNYIATHDNDVETLEKIARYLTEQEGQPHTREDAKCGGCLSDAVNCFFAPTCEVRACAIERGVPNCAHCEDFACDTINAFMERRPPRRDNLEAIRRSL